MPRSPSKVAKLSVLCKVYRPKRRPAEGAVLFRPIMWLYSASVVLGSTLHLALARFQQGIPCFGHRPKTFCGDTTINIWYMLRTKNNFKFTVENNIECTFVPPPTAAYSYQVRVCRAEPQIRYTHIERGRERGGTWLSTKAI